MQPVLYAHPLSSYCQKALIALYENDIRFTFRMLDDPSGFAELEQLWPLKRFPVLVDGGRTIFEATVIIEHLALHRPGPVRLIPEGPAAVEVRMMDRVFDNYVMTPMQTVVLNARRPEQDRDPYGVAEARAFLDRSYRWLDGVMATRVWAAGDHFSMADCAAAPSLFYADWTHEIDPAFAHLRTYRARLLARPSIARAVDEARPFRQFFPLGAPDRD
jgi:glutathione S-transferase